jgi:hypothetical protein
MDDARAVASRFRELSSELKTAEPTQKQGLIERLVKTLKNEAGEVGEDIGPTIERQAAEKAEAQSAESIAAEKTKAAAEKAKPRKWGVYDPSGKNLGDIVVTPDDVAAFREQFGDELIASGENVTDADIVTALFEQRRNAKIEKAGYKLSDEPRFNVYEIGSKEATAPQAKPKLVKAGGKEVVKEGTKAEGKAKTEEMPPIPEAFAGKPVEEIKPKPKPKAAGSLDPEEAFGPGGKVDAINEAAMALEDAGAPDTRFKDLLPKDLRFPLGKGETFMERLYTLIRAIRGAESEEMSPLEFVHEAEMDRARALLEAEEAAKSEPSFAKPKEPPKPPEPPPEPLRAKKFGKEKLEKPPEGRVPPARHSRKWGGVGSAFKGTYPKFETPQMKLIETREFMKRHPELFQEED